jgi:FkbM family methyltransferase
MTGENFLRVQAIHPRWSGCLRLSTVDNSVEAEGQPARGTYRLSGGKLDVTWDGSNVETFRNISELYIHDLILNDAPALSRILAVTVGATPVLAKRISVLIPRSEFEVNLRLCTSDIDAFEQIFVKNEYDSPSLPASADVIVDLGANIGLATVFFGLRYPRAKILAVEPEEENFQALSANTAAWGDRVRTRQAAVWTRDGVVNLRMETDEGTPLEPWAARTSNQPGPVGRPVECHTLKTLLDRAGFDYVDILKIDIEGAEYDIFSDGAMEWLPRVKLIIVETHNWFRPGSNEAVRKAVHPLFEEVQGRGENLFFRRVAR